MIRRNSDVGFADVQYNNRGARSALISGSRADYGYDPVGRLETLTQNVGGVAQDVTYGFGYNPTSQMTSRTTGNDIYVWTGAVNVNRAYAVNGLNQYTSAGNTNFAYDANGNLTQSGITVYTYDIENRLVGVSGGLSAGLRYDPLGRLYEVAGPSSSTRFLYDGDELVAEYDGAGSMLRRYVHGPGSDDPMAWFEGAGVGEGAARFIKSDHQGSVTALVAWDGSLLHINRYDEWGIPGSATQPNTGRFQYTGQIWIPEIGLYYYKARLYSPSLGRFMQTDPIGYDDQVNLYAYVANDPANMVDPDGTEIKIVGDKTYKKRVEGALDRIRKGPDGRAWLEKLEGHDRTITIQMPEDGKGNSAQPTNGFLARFWKGSDVDVEFDPSNFNGGVNDKGSTRRAPFVGLAHELGHAEDMISGRDKAPPSSSEKSQRNHTPNREQNSVMRENMVRREHGLARRSNYTPPSQPTTSCGRNSEKASCQ